MSSARAHTGKYLSRPIPITPDNNGIATVTPALVAKGIPLRVVAIVPVSFNPEIHDNPKR